MQEEVGSIVVVQEATIHKYLEEEGEGRVRNQPYLVVVAASREVGRGTDFDCSRFANPVVDYRSVTDLMIHS